MILYNCLTICYILFCIILQLCSIELCHLYPYPCPKKFYKLPAVLFCYTNLFYKLAWACAWA